MSTDSATPVSVWDSGKITSSAVWANSTVAYGGTTPLTADTRYSWRVKVWAAAADGTVTGASDFSTVAKFQVGLLTSADWRGAVSIQAVVGPPSPPPPPPPPVPKPVPLCTDDCKMLSIPGNKYFSGRFNESQAHTAGSIPDCIATCVCARWHRSLSHSLPWLGRAV